MRRIYHHTDEKGFPYIAWIPETISDHPALMLHLHGAGERGDGQEELDKVLFIGFPNVVNDENMHDCILLMPQCPADTFWVAKLETLGRFLDSMMAEFDADPARIYLTGISMGGFGTWYAAMAYPDRFAAIAPCCGGGMAWNSRILRMPIWTFHGMEDDCVSVNQTLEIKNVLEPCHPDFQCTLYEGVSHNCWDMAYSEELLQWFLSKRKAD